VGTESRQANETRSGIGSYLYALSAKDGKVIWRFEADFRGNDMPNLIHGTPAILDDVVYFGSENGWFYALKAANGRVIWKKLLTQKTRTSAREAASPGLVGVSTAPALGYGKIFVGLWDGRILALDQKDGKILWEYFYGDEGTNSSAVVADGKVCLGTKFSYFYCFNQDTGKIIWKRELSDPSPAAAAGILVVPNKLAAAESPGPILLAFKEAGSTQEAPLPLTIGGNQSIPVNFYLLAAAALAAILILGIGFYLVFIAKKSQRSKRPEKRSN